MGKKFLIQLLTLSLLCVLIASKTAYQRLREGEFQQTLHSHNPDFAYNPVQEVQKDKIGLKYAGPIYSGYIDIGKRGHYFYHVYPANGDTDANATFNNTNPTIMWLQGGPGCSDWIGAMTENGPWQVVKDGNGNIVTELRDINWNQQYNLLFVDQPAGVGFSPSKDRAHNSVEGAEDMVTFFTEFFNIFSSLKANRFYIFGESFAGHYAPSIAAALVANQDKVGVNLTGLGIGNGIVNPYYHVGGYADAGFSPGLVDEKVYAEIAAYGQQGQDAFQKGEWGKVAKSLDDCLGVLGDFKVTGVSDPYDYRLDGEGDPEYFPELFKTREFKEAFGIDESADFHECSAIVYEDYFEDIGRSYADNVTYILDKNIPVLIYSGQDDLVIPTTGSREWVKHSSWSQILKFEAAPSHSIQDETGYVVGTRQSYFPLSFAMVYKAGHMVPQFQPNAAKIMLDMFINGTIYS